MPNTPFSIPDYTLDESLIALEPVQPPQTARMLWVPKGSENVHGRVTDLSTWLEEGDVLVVNRTRVRPARLLGKRRGGGKAEILVLHLLDSPTRAMALVRPGARLRPGSHVTIPGGEVIQVEAMGDKRGERLVVAPRSWIAILEEYGVMPLPPYIHRDSKPLDRKWYQTPFLGEGFSVAAPTASLHFSPPVQQALIAKGVERVDVSLDVGLGTFRPPDPSQWEEGRLHKESFKVEAPVAKRLNNAMGSGRRLVAVGTTTCRVLETQMRRYGEFRPEEGETDLFIRPGDPFLATGALVTNFHLPRSSLLALVCSLGGTRRILEAYSQAIQRRYRFFSYGDAMLVEQA